MSKICLVLCPCALHVCAWVGGRGHLWVRTDSIAVPRWFSVLKIYSCSDWRCLSAVRGLDRSTLDPSRVSSYCSVTRGHCKTLSLLSKKTHTRGFQLWEHMQSSKPPLQSSDPLSVLPFVSRSHSQHKALEGERRRMNSSSDGLSPLSGDQTGEDVVRALKFLAR